MRFILSLLFALSLTINAFALEFHPSDEIPAEGQFIMFAESIPYLPQPPHLIFYIFRYDSSHLLPVYQQADGWYAFTLEDLGDLMKDGIPFHYLPEES